MEITLFIYWWTYLDQAMVSTHERTDSEFVLIRRDVVMIDPVAKPCDEEIRERLLRSLRAEKLKIKADAHMAVKRVDDQIQQLLCLENKS